MLVLWLGAVSLAPIACGGNRGREPVPPETRQRSEEMFGRQQRSMEQFMMTPSEQAGQRFEDDTRPVRPIDEGEPEGEKAGERDVREREAEEAR